MFYQPAHRLVAAIVGMLLFVGVLLPPSVSAQAEPPSIAPAAAKPTTVYLPLVETPQAASSEELIDEALEDGAIDRDTTALYKAFAAFADARLPAQYRGDDDPETMSSSTFRHVMAEHATLKPATQAQIAPFLLPPSAPGSWHELREPARLAESSAQAVPPKVVWRKIEQPSVPFKVWYQLRYGQQDAALAQTVFDTLRTEIWPKLTGLMGAPITDILQPNDGGDGAFDIYLVDNTTMTVPYTGCDNIPAYILLNHDAYNHSKLAIRMMDAILYGYDVDAACSEYNWLQDATAVWAADYVYPSEQYEHQFKPYLEERTATPLPLMRKSTAPEEGITWGSHGRYIWLFFLSRVQGQPGLIRTIWDNSSSQSSIYAINSAIPGGFLQQWPLFAKEAWNRDPAAKFRTLDGLQNGALPVFKEDVKLEGAGQRIYTMPTMVYGLTSNYYHFEFQDEKVSTVLFENTFHDGNWPNIRVTGWVRLEGKSNWEPAEDWTGLPTKQYCRDIRKQRVAEMVVIVSNSDHKNIASEFETEESLYLTASNIGCRGWYGTVRYHYSYDEEDSEVTENFVTSAIFEPVEVPPEMTEELGPMLMFRPQAGTTMSAHFSGWIPHPELPEKCHYDTRIEMPIDVARSGLTIGLDQLRLYGGDGPLMPHGPIDSGSSCVGDLLSPPSSWWETPAEVEERLLLTVSADGRKITGSYIIDGTGYTWELDAAEPE
jgi:hypothetical protein